jgi:prepilin peptidase CpaA
MTVLLAQTLFPLLLVAAGVGDFLTFKIPNWLTAAIAVAFFPMAFLIGLPIETVLWQCGVAIAVLIAGFGLFAFGMWGGGDAKLLAAASLWFGWPALAHFVIYTALAGGVLAVAVAVWSAIHIDQEVRGNTWIARWMNLKPNVPYGVAFAVGGFLAFPETWWMNIH